MTLEILFSSGRTMRIECVDLTVTEDKDGIAIEFENPAVGVLEPVMLYVKSSAVDCIVRHD